MAVKFLLVVLKCGIAHEKGPLCPANENVVIGTIG